MIVICVCARHSFPFCLHIYTCSLLSVFVSLSVNSFVLKQMHIYYESIYRKKDHSMVAYSPEHTHPRVYLWPCIHYSLRDQRSTVCFPSHCCAQWTLDVEAAMVPEKGEARQNNANSSVESRLRSPSI